MWRSSWDTMTSSTGWDNANLRHPCAVLECNYCQWGRLAPIVAAIPNEEAPSTRRVGSRWPHSSRRNSRRWRGGRREEWPSAPSQVSSSVRAGHQGNTQTTHCLRTVLLPKLSPRRTPSWCGPAALQSWWSPEGETPAPPCPHGHGFRRGVAWCVRGARSGVQQQRGGHGSLLASGIKWIAFVSDHRGLLGPGQLCAAADLLTKAFRR